MASVAEMAINGKRWLVGITSALISAVATSVTSGLGTMAVDPDHFNLGAGIGQTLKVVGCTAAVAGVISVSKFLAMHPVPDTWREGDPDRRGGTR